MLGCPEGGKWVECWPNVLVMTRSGRRCGHTSPAGSPSHADAALSARRLRAPGAADPYPPSRHLTTCGSAAASPFGARAPDSACSAWSSRGSGVRGPEREEYIRRLRPPVKIRAVPGPTSLSSLRWISGVPRARPGAARVPVARQQSARRRHQRRHRRPTPAARVPPRPRHGPSGVTRGPSLSRLRLRLRLSGWRGPWSSGSQCRPGGLAPVPDCRPHPRPTRPHPPGSHRGETTVAALTASERKRPWPLIATDQHWRTQSPAKVRSAGVPPAVGARRVRRRQRRRSIHEPPGGCRLR